MSVCVFGHKGTFWCRYVLSFWHLIGELFSSLVQFSYYINNRQPNGSLLNVLSSLDLT